MSMKKWGGCEGSNQKDYRTATCRESANKKGDKKSFYNHVND